MMASTLEINALAGLHKEVLPVADDVVIADQPPRENYARSVMLLSRNDAVGS